MIDLDPFSQFIVVPDDRPILPPVDEDVCGLKDLSSIGFRSDLRTDQENEPSGGLLLGPDSFHNVHQGTYVFNMIASSPNCEKNALFPTYDSSPSHANFFPPALSPDSSPVSVASTSWPRTPETDPALANVNLTPADVLWDIEEEPCSTTHFLDQAGNSLEDIPSQIQDVMMPEDIACTPQVIPNTSLLITTPLKALSNTPIFVVSPPTDASTSPRAESVPFGQAHCTSFPLPSPHTSQPLSLGFSPVIRSPLSACPSSPSLSPLTTVGSFSQSPSASPNPSPLFNCFPLSPVVSPVPLPKSDDIVEDTVSSAPTRMNQSRLRSKRGADGLGDDAPPSRVPKRSKAKNVDEEEWSPGSERVKRSKVSSSSQSTRPMATSIPPVENSDHTMSQGSEGNPESAPTTCQICGQGFTRASDYVRHIQNSASHPESRKVWPCPYCDSALGRKDALGRHIRTLHPGKPVFILEGISESQLPEGQKEPAMQRIGQRRVPLRRQPRKDARTRYR